MSGGPEISLVIPTLNEEEGIRQCIEEAREAFDEMGMDGEVVVSDSSTDRTPEIAEEMGAKVVEPDREGYGYAYRYGFRHCSGDIVAMGDGDTTYDFRELPRLVGLLEDGADLAMGSRLRGEMEPGSMPRLHRYVGNPLLTRFLNSFYGAGVSDAHCGMRAFRRELLDELDFTSDGMEFASEMVMRAAATGMRIEEEPISYRRRKGDATLSSFEDGWRHVRFMLKNAPSRLFAAPAAVLFLLGGLLVGMPFFDVGIGEQMGANSMIAGSLLLILSYQLGMLAPFSVFAADAVKPPRDRLSRFIKSRFSLEKGVAAGASVSLAGACYAALLVYRWISSGYSDVPRPGESVAAFTAIAVGVQTVFYSFFLGMISDGQ